MMHYVRTPFMTLGDWRGVSHTCQLLADKRGVLETPTLSRIYWSWSHKKRLADVMFKITGSIAIHGLGETTYPANRLQEGFLDDTDFRIVDVRDMLDESQPAEVYQKKIEYAVSSLDKYDRIVICCGAGQSRSPAIAIGVLMKKYNMDFYDAYDLVREKVPIAQIEPGHIAALKRIFDVGLP